MHEARSFDNETLVRAVWSTLRRQRLCHFPSTREKLIREEIPMRMMIMALSLLLFQACAAKKLAVEHADTFIESSVEKRLPLYSAQKKELSKEVDEFLEKHKETGRKLIPLVDQINLDDPSKLDSLYNEFVTYYQKIATGFSQILAKHLSELDATQQKKMFEKLSSENKDLERKSPEQRAEGMESKAEQLIGTLTSGQHKFFKDHAGYFHEKAMAKLERRRALQAKLKEVLTQDISATSKREQIQEAFDKYQVASIESSKTNLPLIKTFMQTLNPRQKEAFRGRTQDLKEMIGYYLEAAY